MKNIIDFLYMVKQYVVCFIHNITHAQADMRASADMRVGADMQTDADIRADADMRMAKCVRGLHGAVFRGSIDKCASTATSMLLITHSLDRTGAPVALCTLAGELVKENVRLVVLSPNSGTLTKDFNALGIDVIVIPRLFARADKVDFYDDFDIVFANTIAVAACVSVLNGGKKPVIWWIHEAEVSYGQYKDAMPEKLSDNVRVFCVGGWARKMLNKYKPAYKSDILLYKARNYHDDFHFPSVSVNNPGLKKSNKILFVSAGTLEYRKGQDIVARAIDELDDDVLGQCLFVFAGKKCEKRQLDSIKGIWKKYPDNVKYIGELDGAALARLYDEADYLICSSRDDPMPCVIAEFLTYGKPVICSANTGFTDILKEYGCALFYKDNNPAGLKKCICQVVADRTLKEKLSRRAYEAYIDNFSGQAFRENMKKLIMN